MTRKNLSYEFPKITKQNYRHKKGHVCTLILVMCQVGNAANAFFNFGVMKLQEPDITFTLFKVKDYKQ